MSIDTRNLSGARASSAVRCIAKAEHEALGTPPDPEAQQWLQGHFRRGLNVGRAWASAAKGNVELEAEIPWGLGWTGHADVLNHDDKIVYEVYHAAGGEFREVKALQSAFYADELGPEWKAELVAIDTTDVSDEEGFAVQGYEINVDGLRSRVQNIKERVIAAVQDGGHWNLEDRVGDSPHHQECRSCPFKAHCWDGWQPPAPQDIPGLEADFDALRILQSDLAHAEAKVAEVKRLRDDKRDGIREYLPVGIPVTAGGTTIKVIEVRGRTSVSIADYTKAGFQIPRELEPFVKHGKPSERWTVDKVGP